MPGEMLTQKRVEYLNQQSSAELEARVNRYKADLLAEASRLEAVGNTAGGPPEITSSMIGDADLLLRRGYRKPKKSPWLICAQVGATAGGFLTGMLADLDRLSKPGPAVGFVILLTTTIILTVLVSVRE